MYLAQFELGQQHLVQARVGLPHRALESVNRWSDRYGELLASIPAFGWAAAALKVELVSGRLGITLSLAADQQEESRVRRWVGAFTRVEAWGGAPVDLPMSAAAHDAAAESLDLRCRLNCSGFAVGGHWLACDFRLRPHLGRLLGDAAVLGIDVAYHLHLAQITPTREQFRGARLNSLHLRDAPGIIPAVLDEQERLAESLAGASFTAEEFVACRHGDAAWLNHWLAECFQKTHGRLGFDGPGFDLAANAHAEEIAAGLHSAIFIPPPLDELCASALSAPASVEALSFLPDRRLLNLLGGEGPESHGPPPDVPGGSKPMPSPPRAPGSSPFGFVSYSHADAARVCPLLDRFSREDVPIWWDRGIPGGVEWDAYIEGRIQECSGVLLMLSPRAVASRYCRREVKYADVLGKPVCTIVLEPAELRDGLHMLLSQCQMMQADRADLIDQIRGAVRI